LAFEYDTRADFFDAGDETESMVLESTTYDVICGHPTRRMYREFDDTALELARLFVRCWNTDFSTKPARGDKVTFRSTTWRVIANPVYSSSNTTFLLALGDEFARL